MKKSFVSSLIVAGILLATAPVSFAQDAAPAADPAVAAAPAAAAVAAAPAAGEVVETPPAAATKSGSEFWVVLTGSGWLGVLLWVALFGSMGFYVYLVVECSILVRASKIMPQTLIDNVQASMKDGDVVNFLFNV